MTMYSRQHMGIGAAALLATALRAFGNVGTAGA